MQLDLHPRCGGQIVTLQKVLYVPKLGGNLLAPRQTIKTGNVIDMDTENVFILDTRGNTVANCPWRGDTYCLYERSIQDNEREVALKVEIEGHSKFQLEEIELWHKRYDHLNYYSLCRMLGVPKLATIVKCETCVLGKMTSLPYPKQYKTRATKPLEFIHSDVIYVLTPESIRGENMCAPLSMIFRVSELHIY